MYSAKVQLLMLLCNNYNLNYVVVKFQCGFWSNRIMASFQPCTKRLWLCSNLYLLVGEIDPFLYSTFTHFPLSSLFIVSCEFVLKFYWIIFKFTRPWKKLCHSHTHRHLLLLFLGCHKKSKLNSLFNLMNLTFFTIKYLC